MKTKSKLAYETPRQESIEIHLTGMIAASDPTEPIIKDPEEEI